MNKSNNEFLHRRTDDLRKVTNALQLCWKPLRSNFKKIFLIGGKIFDYFWVTLHNALNDVRITKCIKI